jgi:hypothetical protein
LRNKTAKHEPTETNDMPIKKNKISKYISIMSDDKAFQVSFWRAISIVGGALLVGIVGTAFTIFTTANSDHFLILSNTDRISAVEKTSVRQDVLTEQLAPMRSDILEIKTDIKQHMRETNNKYND